MKYVKAVGRFVSNPEFSFLEVTAIMMAFNQPFWVFIGVCLGVWALSAFIRSASR